MSQEHVVIPKDRYLSLLSQAASASDKFVREKSQSPKKEDSTRSVTTPAPPPTLPKGSTKDSEPATASPKQVDIRPTTAPPREKPMMSGKKTKSRKKIAAKVRTREDIVGPPGIRKNAINDFIEKRRRYSNSRKKDNTQLKKWITLKQ